MSFYFFYLFNGILNCIEFDVVVFDFDEVLLFKVKRDIFYQFKDLYLKYNYMYYVVVVVIDVIGCCIGN